MGFFSFFKKGVPDIETFEGWDVCMQQILDEIEEVKDKKSRTVSRLRYQRVLRWVMLLLSAGCLYYSYEGNYTFDNFFLHISLAFLCIFLFAKIVEYFERKHLNTLTEKQSVLSDKRIEHVNALSKVKARISDITQLLVKYNLDSKYFSTSELDNLSKTINVLLDVIQKLIQLPLCKDCRYYTQEDRREIIKLIPAPYQSLFDKVEPKRMEDMSKPLDEKLMSLLDKQEVPPKVVNVMLLDNQESNKENEDVVVEEVSEEETDERIRKRKVEKESYVC